MPGDCLPLQQHSRSQACRVASLPRGPPCTFPDRLLSPFLGIGQGFCQALMHMRPCRKAAVLTASLLWREPTISALGSSAGSEHSLSAQALSLLEDMAHGLQVRHCRVRIDHCQRFQNETLCDSVLSERFALLLRVVICMKEMRWSLYAKALYRVECANGQSGVRSRCHQALPCYQHHSRQRVKEDKLNRVQLLHNGTLPCT